MLEGILSEMGNPYCGYALMHRVDQYCKQGQYEQALSDLNHAISLAPSNPDYYGFRSRVYRKMGNESKAKEDMKTLTENTIWVKNPEIVKLNASLSRNPRNVSDLIKRCDLLWQRGMFDRALQDLDEAIKIRPGNAEALRTRALLLMASRPNSREKELLQYFNQLAALYPNDVRSFKDRATLLLQMREEKAALDDLNTAIKLGSKDSELYLMRANLLCETFDYTKAAADYSKSIALNPDNPGSYIGRAECYAELGEFQQSDARLGLLQKSLADYNVAARLLPNDKSILADRAKVYEKLGKHDDAIAYYTTVIKRDPTGMKDGQASYRRASLYEKTGRYQEAINDLSASLDRDERSSTNLFALKGSYIDRARLWVRLNQPDKAIADLNKVISIDSLDVDAYKARAPIFERLNQLDKAIADLSKIISIDHRDVDAYLARASLYERLKDYEKAAGDYSGAIKSYYHIGRQADSEPDFYHRRCLCYEKLGKHELAAADRRSQPYRSLFVPLAGHPNRQRSQEAVVEYTKSIATDRNDSIAYFMRGWNYLQLGEKKKAMDDLTASVKPNEPDSRGMFQRVLAGICTTELQQLYRELYSPEQGVKSPEESATLILSLFRVMMEGTDSRSLTRDTPKEK